MSCPVGMEMNKITGSTTVPVNTCVSRFTCPNYYKSLNSAPSVGDYGNNCVRIDGYPKWFAANAPPVCPTGKTLTPINSSQSVCK